jgi:hypothetical protein
LQELEHPGDFQLVFSGRKRITRLSGGEGLTLLGGVYQTGGRTFAEDAIPSCAEFAAWRDEQLSRALLGLFNGHHWDVSDPQKK